MKTTICLVSTQICFALAALYPAMGADQLQNGAMEDPFSSNVAVPWTFYSGGGGLSGIAQSRETTIVHGGSTSQRLAANVGSGGSAARIGIRQTIDANIGDAFTFGGWVWPNAAGTYNETSMRVDWAGGIDALTATVLSSWLPTGAQDQAWHEMPLAGGNATATSVTLFLHSRRNSSNGSLLTYWDDVVGYHAYVPPAPTVGNPTGSTFDFDVAPGGNSGNLFAEYAITIGGGGYTLGSDWIQPDGSVGGGSAWRSDTLWGNGTVTGLEVGMTYDIQVKARYSSTIVQETYLGATATIATVPEPTALVLFGLGILALIRRR